MAFIKLNELAEKEPFPGCRLKFVHSGNMSLVYWHFEPNTPIPAHQHPHEQVANVIEGRFELTVGGETKLLEPGMVAVIPPNVVHSGKAITECRIIDVFHPVREDFTYDD